jgi:CBS domain-containing protein
MAQSPEMKTGPSSERIEPTSREDRPRQAERMTEANERRPASAALNAGEHAAEAARDTTQQADDALRRGATASGEATRFATQTGTQAIGRGMDALTEGHRRLLSQATDRMQTISQRMVDAVQETTEGFRTFARFPVASADNLRDMQTEWTGAMGGVVQSNMRTVQELFRVSDPTPLMDLQRRFVNDWVGNLLQGTGTFIRFARGAADQTLHPIDAQIERWRYVQGREAALEQGRGVVADVMTSHVRLANPEDTIQQATRLMREEDTGVLPVGEGDRLVGIVTDRDVALRVAAEGKDPARTKVREVMTQEIKYVFEDEDLAHVADNMAEQQVRRLPVVNRNKRIVGVISLGDLARASRSGHYAGRAMRGITRDAAE